MSDSWNQGPTSDQLARDVAYLRALQGNAESLLRDADLLFSHGRWARALALAVLAMEEAGKAVLATARLFPDDDLAELKPTRHEDKLTTAGLVEVGFLGDLSEVRTLIGQLDSSALHREKLSALYVDQREGDLRCPTSVAEERAEQVLAISRRITEWLGSTYNTLSPESIEAARRLTSALTPALDQYVIEYGEEAGLDMARRIVDWGQRLARGETAITDVVHHIGHIANS